MSNKIVFSVIATAAILLSSFSGQQSSAQEAAAAASPVPVQSAVILAPTNSRISFVGIHVGDDPKPRLGGFAEFSGYAVVDPDKGAVTSMMLDINVDSVWTQFEKLTGHLKNEDFFETEKFPTAKFVSTSITAGENGSSTITGNLTLHGETKEVSFPADVKMENGGMVLNATFQLDRSIFGMDKMLSGVDKLVKVEIVVGEKTAPSKAEPGHGGKKKKQSSTETSSKLQNVSLNVPNMT
jgi:polyisoprenoid-binding protein YceI